MCFARTSAGLTPPWRNETAAAVPTAWPIVAQVAITRVAESAMCVTEMSRPANIRFGTLTE